MRFSAAMSSVPSTGVVLGHDGLLIPCPAAAAAIEQSNID